MAARYIAGTKKQSNGWIGPMTLVSCKIEKKTLESCRRWKFEIEIGNRFWGKFAIEIGNWSSETVCVTVRWKDSKYNCKSH